MFSDTASNREEVSMLQRLPARALPLVSLLVLLALIIAG